MRIEVKIFDKDTELPLLTRVIQVEDWQMRSYESTLHYLSDKLPFIYSI